MTKTPFFLGFCAVLVMGCTPPAPTMDVEEAMLVCRAQVSKPVDTELGLGISAGSGGKVRPTASISVGVDLSAATNPQKAFENCVRRNAGVAPTEEF